MIVRMLIGERVQPRKLEVFQVALQHNRTRLSGNYIAYLLIAHNLTKSWVTTKTPPISCDERTVIYWWLDAWKLEQLVSRVQVVPFAIVQTSSGQHVMWEWHHLASNDDGNKDWKCKTIHGGARQGSGGQLTPKLTPKGIVKQCHFKRKSTDCIAWQSADRSWWSESFLMNRFDICR